ncbi:MAG: hypothetical protein DMG07_07415 [Acidobacteria bacterium]|nr:MAG: hypothetical protein DMG07_07415 [Acidobacteriota bacterium]
MPGTALRASILSLLLLGCTLAGGANDKPVDLGSRLELFVDDFLIATARGVELRLHEPRPAGTVLVFDKPWEGVTSGYVTVFKDGDLFRMYYRGSSDPSYTMKSALRPGEQVVPGHDQLTCYAESRDGITWTRPSLGLFEFKGSKDNNIVWNGPGAHNLGPFRDENPAAPPDERYKAVGSDSIERRPVLLGFVSADGKRWRLLRREPILTDGKFDSLNVVFWDAVRGHYTAIYRDFIYGVRTIKHATSMDFRTWSPGEWADFGDAPAEHLYTNATVAYYRAPHIYLALPRRFLPWKTYYKEMETMSPGVSDAVFMSSRDGVHWRRFEEAFIRPGRDERNWVHRANTPARGMVQTAPGEISIYVERNYTFPTNQVERLVLRTDGFVSASAPSAAGELVTKPFVFSGGNLLLNYSTSANGHIRIEVQDAIGHPLPGFALEESPLLWGDRIDAPVQWARPASKTDPEPLRRLAGKPVRLRFVMRDADLYSIQFK